MNFYVYILIDPRNDIPFYVGKGNAKRYQNHEKEFEKQIEYLSTHYAKPEKALSLKHRVFYDLKKENLKYKYELIENLSEDDSLLLEHAFIAWFGRLICGNGVLTNLLCGGRRGELFFDDEQLIRIVERPDLQKHLLRFKKLSTNWTARTLYFYDSDRIGYPFKELKIDWLYQYRQCNQQFAVKVIELLKIYDAVITPFYWIRRVNNNDFKLDNIYIMRESQELIDGAFINQETLTIEQYENEYLRHLKER